jgi:CO dehydrogenase nickel-insertion accessory protein CooC1
MNENAKGTNRRRIYWIGGCKGGVGKSMLTSATIDYLLDAGSQVVLVESDTSNPDVFKSYESLLPTELINLDKAQWMGRARQRVRSASRRGHRRQHRFAQ